MGVIRRTVIVMGVVGLGVFLLAEVLLRLLQYPSLQYYRDLKLLHVYSPRYRVGLLSDADFFLRHQAGLWEGRFTTSSLGYRGSPEPDPQKGQLACLGDSIVMGFGVSDRYTFCRKLNGLELNGQIHQAQNLGVDAFGSRGALERLREASERLDLDYVLYFISPNDFTLPPSLLEQGVRPDDEKEKEYFQSPGRWQLFRVQFELTRSSYTLMAMRLALEQLSIKYRTLIAELHEFAGQLHSPLRYLKDSLYHPVEKEECKKKKSTGVEKKTGPESASQVSPKPDAPSCPRPVPDHIQCADKPDPASLAKLDEFTASSYRGMIELSREKGFHLIPVVMPIQMEALHCLAHDSYHPLFSYALRARHFFEQNGVRVLSLEGYEKRMCGELLTEKNGVNGVNGVDRYSRIQDYFIPGDGHFTIAGNRLAAEAIRRRLKELEKQNAL